MRNIIITGGRGLLATELTRRLLAGGDCNLYLVSRSPQDIQPADHLQAIELGQLVDDKALRGLNYDAVVHTAFARGNDGRELFASLSYTEALLQAMRRLDVKSFINVSSQGIYGPDNHGVMWKETSRVAPGYPYTIAKSFSRSARRPVRASSAMIFHVPVSSLRASGKSTCATPPKDSSLCSTTPASNGDESITWVPANRTL